MSQDKLGLGKLIEPGAEHERDAIHIAVIPMLACERLKPGEHIGLPFEGDTKVAGKTGITLFIGIVDPYLNKKVEPGDRFWMYLYPGSIISLRHVWEHPVLPEGAKIGKGLANGVSSSEQWLREYAETLDTGYNALVGAARYWVDHDEYFSEGGKFEGVSLDPEFWEHYEKVSQTEVPDDKKSSFFSCSC